MPAISTQVDTKANLFNEIWGALVGLLIAISPKCPFCWLAYLSAFGVSGTIPFGVYQWITPVLCLLFIMHLYVIGRRAFRRKYFAPLYLSTFGFLCIVIGLLNDILLLRYTGVGVILLGSIVNVLPQKKSPSPCSCGKIDKT